MEEKQRNYTTWLVIIAVLLLLNVTGIGYQIYSDSQRSEQLMEMIAEENALDSQRSEKLIEMIAEKYALDSLRLEQRREQVKKINAVSEIQSKSIFSLLDDYLDAAYNSSLDRIAEQQLTATEYTIQGLQIIAIQNLQIIRLLSLDP